MLELRLRTGCPGPGAAGVPPPREGEAAGGDHETESTSDKVSECGGARRRPRDGCATGGPAHPPGRAGQGLSHLNLTALELLAPIPSLWGLDGTHHRRRSGCQVAATSLAFPP